MNLVKLGLDAVESIIPELKFSLHKGSMGKIGILGGCKNYTGAPFYAGMSALKIGADLVWIFCSESAAVPIKSYSPELMVLPVFGEVNNIIQDINNVAYKQHVVREVEPWLDRLSVLVFGPGFGKDQLMIDCAEGILEKAKSKNLPLVLDGDALSLICEKPEIIRGYKNAILTPNMMEFKRLCSSLISVENAIPKDFNNDTEENLSNLQKLCQELGNVTILQKGYFDIISNGNEYVKCDQSGSPRRCGGQGDVLAGTVGTFLSWANTQEKKNFDLNPHFLAAFGASSLLKFTNKNAFEKHGRSLTTPNIIEFLPESFKNMYG